ncbi:MAG: hypothetical protein ACI4SG_06750 [Oligosphaeraceae bacterium]
MNKIRSVISRLEAFFARENWSNSPTFQRLLGDYNQVCEELNQRLGKCEALLASGKKAEALLSAEKSPSLFEVVPPLQGPGILKFLEVCNGYQLPPPRVLKTSVFQSLLEVQNEPATLEEWIGIFRSMSRSGASEEKLIVLRRITALQPNDPEWANQLRHAEVAFIPGLIGEAKQDIQNGNWDALAEKEEMFASPTWRASVPDVVVEKVRRTLEEVRNREFGVQAEQILQELEASLAADSFPDFMQAADHWQILCELDRYLPSEEESLRFSRVEDHFAEQKAEAVEEQAFNSAVMRMRFFMESPEEHSYEETMENYRPLMELGRPVPEDIQEFVREVGKKWRRQKVKATFLTILVLGLLAVGGAGGGFFWYLKEQRIQQLETAVERKDVALAEEQGKKLAAPWWRLLKKDKQRILALEGELEELARQEEEFLQDLENWRGTYVTEEMVETGETGEGELEDLASLAETKESRRKLSEVKEEAKEFRENLRGERTREMRTTLDALANLEQQFDALAQAAAWEEMNDLLREVSSLQAQARGITFYDEACMDDEDRERLDFMWWKIRKHLVQYKAIMDKLVEIRKLLADEKALEAQQWPDLFWEISAWLEDYDNQEKQERDLPWECKKRQPGLVEASILQDQVDTMKRSYMGKRRAWVLREGLHALEDLSKKFQEGLAAGDWEATWKTLAEYKMRYEALKEQSHRRGTSSEEGAAWRTFDKLQNPGDMEKEWESQKKLEEFMLTFQEGLSNLAVPEVRQKFLQMLEKGQADFGEAGKMLSTLAYQLKSLGTMTDWRTGALDLSDPPTEKSVKCFVDLWRYVNWKQQEKRLFEEARNEVFSLADLYKERARHMGYFGFQDAKGELHEWIFGKVELAFLNQHASSRKDKMRFSIGNCEFSIQDQNVEVIHKRTDGRSEQKYYFQCTFPGPQKKENGTVERTKFTKKYIARRDLEEAGVPLDPSELAESLQKLEKTFLSPGFVELLLDQQRPPRIWMDLRCHYAAALLEPWYVVAQHGRRSKAGQENLKEPMAAVFALPELEKEWQTVEEMREKMDTLLGLLATASYGDKFSLVDDLVRKRFLEINFLPLKRIAGSLNAYYALQKKINACHFSCVGVAWGQREKLTLNPQVKESDGEVWALLPPPRGTRRVGTLRKGKVVLDADFWNAYSDDVVLLVTPGDQVDSAKWAREFQEELSALGGSVPCLPSFFPVNASVR